MESQAPSPVETEVRMGKQRYVEALETSQHRAVMSVTAYTLAMQRLNAGGAGVVSRLPVVGRVASQLFGVAGSALAAQQALLERAVRSVPGSAAGPTSA